MITLENYIMESDISDATVGDIYVEQALAEMEVAYALANSYMKDAMFVEYLAEAEGVDIYQEAADSDKKSFKEKLGDLGGKIKDAPGRAVEFLKSMASAIVTGITNFWHFMTEKSLKSCIKKLNSETQLELTYPVRETLSDNLEYLIATANEFVKRLNQLIKVGTERNATFVNSNEIDKRTKILATDGEIVEKSASECLNLFERLQNSEIPKRIKSTIKSFKDFIKECDRANKNEYGAADDRKAGKAEYKENKKLNRSALKNVKNEGTIIIKAYNQLVRDYRELANHILKDERALMKAYKKTGDKRIKALGKLQTSRDDYRDNMYGFKTHRDKPEKTSKDNTAFADPVTLRDGTVVS